MTILKFEVDTNDIYDEKTFEDEVTRKLLATLVPAVLEAINKEKMNDIFASATEQVVKKLENLINEDIALTDRWGKPVFVGSVEDYMKKQIDEKMLSPVDSTGKPVNSCTSDRTTWIEWKIGKDIEDHLRSVREQSIRSADNFCRNHLKSVLDEYQQTTMKGTIMKALEAIGIK